MIDPEAAVRSYLVALDDPTKLVDESKIADLEAAVRSAADPIDKLKALAELERVRNVNVATYQLAFIQHAKQWAAEHNIPGSTFQTFGVDDDTLRAAGLLSRSQKASASPRRSRSANGTRSNSVSADQIKAHVATRTGVFTLVDLATSIGGSPMTLRKAIGELVAEGVVEKLGTDPSHSGRGRAPIVYVRI
jgi:Bacterial regulatory proteins, gntR family